MGNPVKSTGEIQTKEGKLLAIINESGLYRPELKDFSTAFAHPGGQCLQAGPIRATGIQPPACPPVLTGYRFLARSA